MSQFVDRLVSVTLEAPKASQTASFYVNDWGLTLAAQSEGRAFLHGSGNEHHILELSDRPENRLGAVTLSSPDRAALERLHSKATAQGVRIIAAPAEQTGPAGGYGFSLLDPEGRRINIVAGLATRADTSGVRGQPIKISHVVINTPQVQAMQQFYCDLFEFVVSDWSESQMVFIRCNGDHHNIAFNRAEFPSLNHVSFLMRSEESVRESMARMEGRGRPVKWGAGCHGIGGIMFAYFIDPNGFVIEYNHYVRAFDPNTHEAKVWKRTKETMDSWGTAGIPSSEIRDAMSGGFQSRPG